MIYKPDSRGWYPHEKAQIRLGWWLLLAHEAIWFKPLRALTRGRVMAHKSNLWLTFASWGYLHTDLQSGDMPENVRIGGVWR